MKNRVAYALRYMTRMCVAAAMGMVVLTTGMYIADRHAFHARILTPGTHWFEVTQLEVSDAAQGLDPLITSYDRVFHFTGRMTMRWDAAVYNVDTGQVLCTGAGVSPNYGRKARVQLPVSVVSWWLGKNTTPFDRACSTWPFPVGRTCLVTEWEFTPRDEGGYWGEKSVTAQACWNTTRADGP